MSLRAFHILLLILIVPGWSASAQKMKPLRWLPGTWQMETGKGIVYEGWHQANDSTLWGRSFAVKAGKDTVVFETIQIARRGEKYYYIPTVSNQNNGQPVAFEITHIGAREFVAENPAHDFPQRISYHRHKDRLEAWIDGRINGEYSKRTFSFVRIK